MTTPNWADLASTFEPSYIPSNTIATIRVHKPSFIVIAGIVIPGELTETVTSFLNKYYKEYVGIEVMEIIDGNAETLSVVGGLVTWFDSEEDADNSYNTETMDEFLTELQSDHESVIKLKHALNLDGEINVYHGQEVT